MAKFCDKCGKEKVMKPAGVSKRTGKPYSAFEACPDANCWKKTAAPMQVVPSSGSVTRVEFKELEERVRALELSNDPDGEDVPF